MPACPSARAAHLHHLRHDVAELLERVERLARARGAVDHDLARDSDEVWFAVIPLHDSLQAFLSRPWDASDPPDAFDAAVWLRRVLEGTKPVGAVAFPDDWEAHAERLSRPESRQALREILERLEPIQPAESPPDRLEADLLPDPSGATSRSEGTKVSTDCDIIERAIQSLGRSSDGARLVRWLSERPGQSAHLDDIAVALDGARPASAALRRKTIRTRFERTRERLELHGAPVRLEISKSRVSLVVVAAQPGDATRM